MKKIKLQLSSVPLLIALLAGSAAMLIAGSCLSFRIFHFEDHAVVTEGIVSELVMQGDQLPVIRFTTADGKPGSFTSSLFGSSADHWPGEKVRLLYDAADPSRAAIIGTLWETPRIIFGLGTLLLFFNAACYFFFVRERSRPDFSPLLTTH
jgi:hypothetical protein